jgi:hypothetical protein
MKNLNIELPFEAYEAMITNKIVAKMIGEMSDDETVTLLADMYVDIVEAFEKALKNTQNKENKENKEG